MPTGSPVRLSLTASQKTELDKAHAQNTDTKLDEGGTNEVTAAAIKALVPAYNDIGVAGKQGYGVGIIPESMLPDDMQAMAGTTTPGHDNYGNYQRDDGSVTVWVPAFYVKIGTGANGFGVNQMVTLPFSAFADEAAANAAGYMLPRAFTDGGSTYYGFFYDKYRASKLAWGTGYVPGSIKNGLPISTHADHNPIADLTACTANAYYEAVTAAKAIGGVNGAEAADPQWHVISMFQSSTIAILSMAHGQAAKGTTYCAWYDATDNFPKGCNNNALSDTDDGTVMWESDGYSNCGKTGSAGYGSGAGNVFAKSTHNGQNCGIADVNGLMWEVNIGVTCEASSSAIEDISRANPANVQITGHGRTTGNYAMLTGIDTGDWAGLDDKIYAITVVDADNFTLDGVDTSGFGTAYVVGTNAGAITFGDFYAAKEATAMKDFTPGNSAATDHWGATGVAAMMEPFDQSFVTAYPDNGFVQRMGSGANQVLSEALTGNANILTNLGIPKDADGMDTTGTNLFGKDYFYQYIRAQLCVLSAGYWDYYSAAGVWGVAWSYHRARSHNYVVSAAPVTLCWPR